MHNIFEFFYKMNNEEFSLNDFIISCYSRDRAETVILADNGVLYTTSFEVQSDFTELGKDAYVIKYLLTDGHFRGPRENYYAILDDFNVVNGWLCQSDDGVFEKTLEETTIFFPIMKHPSRCLRIQEIREVLNIQDYKTPSVVSTTDTEEFWMIIDLNEYESTEWKKRPDGEIEYLELRLENEQKWPEWPKKVKKTISYWQGSPEYEIFEDNFADSCV